MSGGGREDLDRRVARIEGLIREIEASADPALRDAARDLTGALLDLHRAGLGRVFAILADAGAPGRAVLDACAKDEVVASLMALHDLALPKAAPPPDLVQIRRTKAKPARESERCDLCGADITPDHPHLLDPGDRKISCACPACAILFESPSARYRSIPRRILSLDGFKMSDAQWDALGVPVHLAFFFRSAREERVTAVYPSPAGLMESSPSIGAWDDIVHENPLLRDLMPDVEALLVHRIGRAREHFLCPIDRCFALAGLVRSHRSAILAPEIDRFLAGIRAEARRAA